MNTARVLLTITLATLPGIASLHAQARPVRPENVVAKVDEEAVLRVKIDRMAVELDEMKKSQTDLKAELEKKSLELALRTTVLEAAEQKSGNDLKKFQAQFANHTHAMPNIGVINPASLGSGSQIGVLWVPMSSNASVDLSRTGKPVGLP